MAEKKEEILQEVDCVMKIDEVDFNGIEEPERRKFLNQTPTSFSLTDEQVDELIAAGGELPRHHLEFRRLLADMAAEARLGHQVAIGGQGLLSMAGAAEELPD